MSGLDADRLIEAAFETTGLNDFGAPAWREGFDVLTEALATEADLNDIGRHAFSLRLASYLEQRLSVVDWRKRHPEIGRQPVQPPAIIVGLPRTGTTALSNLLAQDPATRSLRVWESAAPTPPPRADSYWSDPRIERAQQGLDMMDQFVPELKVMHDDTATSTAEAIDLLGMSFRTHHFSGMASIPSYDRWWLDCDMEPAYRFHRDTLQLLQWRCPPHRWHLKNPPDVFCLDAVTAVYPQARFVWTHRDPAQVLPSVCSLIATVRGMASDRVDRRSLGNEILEIWSLGIERALRFRDRHPETRFVDMAMSDLVADPIDTVRRIYGKLDWPFTAETATTLAQWSERNAPGRHGEHRPAASDFGLSTGAIRERFAEYVDRFDVDSEK